MNILTAVYSDPFEVNDRLNGKFGFSQEILWEALRDGYALARSMTENDPPASRGIATWGKITRRLREVLIPLGCMRSDQQRYSTTVHQSTKWGIAVSAGDWRTGLEKQIPSTSAEKGISMKSAVGANQSHFSLIDPEWESQIGDKNTTWVLLYYFDKDTGEARAELSLPISVSEGRITGWAARLILTTPAEMSGAGPIVVPINQIPEADEIVVPVRKKG